MLQTLVGWLSSILTPFFRTHDEYILPFSIVLYCSVRFAPPFRWFKQRKYLQKVCGFVTKFHMLVEFNTTEKLSTFRGLPCKMFENIISICRFLCQLTIFLSPTNYYMARHGMAWQKVTADYANCLLNFNKLSLCV